MEVLFLIGRIIFGRYFIKSGINHFKNLGMMSGYVGSKGVPRPKDAVAGSGILLLLGGISMLLGLYPRIGIICLLLFLIPVSIKMHDYWNIEHQQEKIVQKINFEKNIALAGVLLILLIIPTPWVLSL